MRLPRLGLGLRRAVGRRLRGLEGRRTTTIAQGAAKGLKFRGASAGLSFAGGLHERPVQRALEDALRPGDVFVDIGANVGFFTILGARLVGPSGWVYAFEPVAKNAGAVRRNAMLNGFDHVSVREEAISDASGHAGIHLTRHHGGATLCSTGIVPVDAYGQIVVVRRALDDLVSSEEIRPPNLIKLDVEGAELEALRGMKETLTDYRPRILYEVDDSERKVLEQRDAEIRSFLLDLGYAVDTLDSSYANVSWNVVHCMATTTEPKAAQRG